MDTFLLFILLLVITISAMIKTNELEKRIEDLENKEEINVKNNS